MKKFIAKLLIIACLVTSVGPIPTLNVQAANYQSEEQIVLLVGQTYQIEAKEPVVEWTSSRASYVSVDQNGLVTAVVSSSRTSTITGTHEDGTTETYEVKVLDEALSEYEKTVSLNQKTRKSITIDSDYDYKNLTWTVADPSIVEVTKSSYYIYFEGLMPGETTVTLHTEVGDVEVKVTVKDSFQFYTEEYWLLNDRNLTLSLSDDFDEYYWENSNPEVAELKAGSRVYERTVVPKKPGKTVITARNEFGQVAQTTVNVFKSYDVLELNTTSMTVYLGDTLKVGYTASPSEAETNNKVTIKKITNTDAFEITEDGVIVPKRTYNRAQIMLSAVDSYSPAQFGYVTIIAPSFDDNFYSINQFTTFDLSKKLNCGKGKVTWSSANPNIAKVDQNGVITGVMNAAAKSNCTTITADCGGYKVSTDVEVLMPYISDKTATVYVKESYTLGMNRTHSNIGPVTWSSSNTKVATVDQNGKVVGKKAGTATITATYMGVKHTCKVTVKGATLSDSSKILVAKQTYKLSVRGATGKVKWSTSKKSVVTVSSSGKITAKKAGTAYIYAKVDGKKLKCKVTVKANQITYKVNKRVGDYTYGPPEVVLSKVYYSGSTLKADIYVMNNRMFRANKFKWLTVKIYDNNGKLIATKKFKNINLGIKPYKYKKITLKFSGSSLKQKSAILNNGVRWNWEYYYTYTIR